MLALILATLTGCGGGGAADVTAPSNGAPASLVLSPAAGSLTPGSSVQLTASGKDASGNTIPNLPTPTFSVADQNVATVDPTGLVTAVAVGATEVTATLDGAGIASAAITVTAAGSAGGSTVTTPNETFSPGLLSIAPGSTVTWEISGATHNVTFTGPAPAGGNVPDTQAGTSASRTFETAGTYPYHCTRHSGMSGTVVVESGAAPPPAPAPTPPPTSAPTPPPAPPASATTVTTPNETFSPGTVTVAPGSTVAWQISGARHNVTFSGTAPAGGNIPDTDPGNTISRTFDSAGSYAYQCTRHSGMSGTVVVQGAGATPPPTQPPPSAGTTITVNADAFTPDDVTIASGESVTWQFTAPDGITFEDDSPPGGDIPLSASGTSVTRTFTLPGVYKYESTRDDGIDGRIRVR
jgi:plastocyanin